MAVVAVIGDAGELRGAYTVLICLGGRAGKLLAKLVGSGRCDGHPLHSSAPVDLGLAFAGPC